jgi:hypothetical protein
MGFIAKACKCKSDRVKCKIVWLSQIFVFILNLVSLFFILFLQLIKIQLECGAEIKLQLCQKSYQFEMSLIG